MGTRIIDDGQDIIPNAVDYSICNNLLEKQRVISSEYLQEALRARKNFNHIILEPNLCYGCGACVATCPKKCLKFEKDVLGFRRVQMAMEEDCVSCGKCSSVCPISSCNKETDNVFRRFYGQIKNNKILMESSSGGAFSAISELWIKNGGVVWGYQLMKMQKQALYVLTELIIFIKYVDLNM